MNHFNCFKISLWEITIYLSSFCFCSNISRVPVLSIFLPLSFITFLSCHLSYSQKLSHIPLLFWIVLGLILKGLKYPIKQHSYKKEILWMTFPVFIALFFLSLSLRLSVFLLTRQKVPSDTPLWIGLGINNWAVCEVSLLSSSSFSPDKKPGANHRGCWESCFWKTVEIIEGMIFPCGWGIRVIGRGLTFPAISKLQKVSQRHKGEMLFSEDLLGRIFLWLSYTSGWWNMSIHHPFLPQDSFLFLEWSQICN